MVVATVDSKLKTICTSLLPNALLTKKSFASTTTYSELHVRSSELPNEVADGDDFHTEAATYMERWYASTMFDTEAKQQGLH